MMRSLLLMCAVAMGLTVADQPTGAAGTVRAFIRHDVTDYDAWRQAYDDFEATRRKVGVTAQAVHRSTDNDKDITVTHDFKSLEAAKAFAGSAELKAAMEKAGVASPPQITLTTLAGKATGAAGSVQMFVRHEVVDYAEWRKVYDAFDAKRRTMHVEGQAVYQSADDPNDVIVTHGFKTLDEAKALAESSELKDAMGKAGVRGVPQIWITTRAAK